MRDRIQKEIEELKIDARKRKKTVLVITVIGIISAVICLAVIWLGLPVSEPAKLLTINALLGSVGVSLAGCLAYGLIALNTRVQKTAFEKGWRVPGKQGYQIPKK